MVNVIAGIVLSYLVGSIPTAYIFGKVLKGIDIREHGSGNVGATNVFRVLGKWPGIGVLILDILKGVIPVVVISEVLLLENTGFLIVLAICAVIGHNWTIFLGFKGGKGIATSLGVLIGLAVKIAAIRPVLFCTVIAWVIVFLITGIVSLSSIVASVILPVSMLLTFQDFLLISLGVVFCVFVVFRHRPNIKRMLDGSESRVKLPFHK